MKSYPYKERWPVIAGTCFVADGARIIGDVTLLDNVSIWFNAVIRGDSGKIVIGENSNIQDNSTVHTDKGKPCIIGNNVTVGHNAVIHACTLGDNSLVGMGATILSGAVVESGSVVAAGAVLGENKTVPAGTLYAGVPARFIRNLSEEEKSSLRHSALNYLAYAQEYKNKNYEL